MKILRMTVNDPAGTSILFTNAVNKYTEHTSRLITTDEKYKFCFKKDIHIPDGYGERYDEIQNLLQQADIFHFEILSDESMEIGPFKVKDYIKGKKITHTHHGHPIFRSDPEKYRQKYKKLKRKVLVSTPDLLLGMPNATWMPNLVPINDPLYMPTEERYPEFTVGHSPTKPAIKDTVTLLKAAEEAGVNVDIIMNTPHAECLKRKQKCHILFEHLQGYYGVSSLEGLSMGKRVIANLSDWVKVNIKEFAESEIIPWDDNSLLLELNHAGAVDLEINRHWMIKHWSDKKVVNRLIKFYEGL